MPSSRASRASNCSCASLTSFAASSTWPAREEELIQCLQRHCLQHLRLVDPDPFVPHVRSVAAQPLMVREPIDTAACRYAATTGEVKLDESGRHSSLPVCFVVANQVGSRVSVLFGNKDFVRSPSAE